ncbi:MAG: nuclear transport factor 2 family protein [Acidobacteriales bacterium]|nr:nuclear transport factor 2 family protein [Terriglobales bacterium]
MRALIRLLIPLFLLTSFSMAQKDPKLESEFMRLEKAWAAAITKKDIASLDKLIAAEWKQVQPSGRIQTKAEMLKALQASKQGADAAEITEVQVMDFGNMVQVIGRVVEKSKVAGQERDGEYVFADLFVKRDGRWQAVYSHTTKVDKK